ncbi:MAG: hypothetical protein ACYTEN_09585 [Planctomycetota bacterium]|jgi:hypothetical protein
MKPLNQTEDRIRQTKPDVETPVAMDSRILMDSYAAMGSGHPAAAPSGHDKLRRILMKNSIKFTAAAVILIAATLSLTIWDAGITPAYALEQTIAALHSVKSIHTRIYYPIHPEPALVWAEFYENGLAKRIRVSQPAFDPHDGSKEAVWENNTAHVWSKKTNTLYHIQEREQVEKISMLFQDLDPKRLIEKLETMGQEGQAQLTIEQPDDISEPIVVTVLLSEEDLYFGHKAIALVDQATKLVISLETFKGDLTLGHKNGHGDMYDFNKLEFFDYNQPFEDDIYILNVPDDVIVIDRATNIVGLSRGDRSIKDTAIEVVNRFFQSILDEDYETAGLMYGGIPAEKIREALNKPKGHILRVISIGTANIHPNPDYENKAFIVPCTLEYMENEQVKQKTYNCVVREVDDQPGQWAICGGI